MTDEQLSLDQQIANLTQNLALIEQRMSEYVLSTDVPLQLVREKEQLAARLAELSARRDRGPLQGDLTTQPTLDDLPLDIVPAVGPLPPAQRLQLAPNPLFVGREEELRTLATTLKAGGAIAVAAATGAGGIGKSQLAVEFAHRYGRFFSGGVFWLSFADPAGVANEIAQCGLAMPELPANLDERKLDEQVRLVRQEWQSPTPRLLIFDNCEEPDLFAQWRPSSGGCRILITSRRAAWAPTLGVTTLPLETLPRAQCIRLLEKFLSSTNEPVEHSALRASHSALDAIASELGDLPLALHLAGSYLARYRD